VISPGAAGDSSVLTDVTKGEGFPDYELLLETQRKEEEIALAKARAIAAARGDAEDSAALQQLLHARATKKRRRSSLMERAAAAANTTALAVVGGNSSGMMMPTRSRGGGISKSAIQALLAASMQRLRFIQYDPALMQPENLRPMERVGVTYTVLMRKAGILALPEDLSAWSQSLRYLDLAGNKLRELPEAMGDLKRLEALSLADNSLQGELTSALFQCTTLKHLDISRNTGLKKLPDGIGSC